MKRRGCRRPTDGNSRGEGDFHGLETGVGILGSFLGSRKNAAKGSIEARDEFCLRAEICGEAESAQGHFPEASGSFRAQEALDARLPEGIDGLFRIAHQEDCL